MSRSLESVIEEIAENEEMSREFIAMDEIDEIYEYCKNMGLGSSEEEFDEEVSSMIDNFDIYLSHIDKNDLSLVAGRINLNKKFNKVLASALSALTLAGAGAVNLDKAAAMNSAVSSSASTVSTEDKTKDASKDDKGAPASDHYSKKLVEKNATGKQADNASIKDKFFKAVESAKNFVSKHKVGTGVTTAAIILVIAYVTGVAKTGKWNPVRWFGNQSTPEGSSSGGYDDAKWQQEADALFAKLKFDNKTRTLDSHSATAFYEFYDKCSSEQKKVLSERLDSVTPRPAPPDSSSQPSGTSSGSDPSAASNPYPTAVAALENQLRVGLGENGFIYDLSKSFDFNDTHYDFSGEENADLRKKLESHMSALFADDSGAGNTQNPEDMYGHSRYAQYCFYSNAIPAGNALDYRSSNPKEVKAFNFVESLLGAMETKQ